MECTAAFDILVCCEGLTEEHIRQPKQLLLRIVAMLTKMTAPLGDVREEMAPYRIELEDEVEDEDGSGGWG